MSKLKYANNYEKIRLAQEDAAGGSANSAVRPFDLDAISKRSIFQRIASRLTKPVLKKLAFPILRRLPFTVSFFGMTWVTRYEDVLKVLGNPDLFEVPFGLEMTELAGGVNFALGDDGDLHDRQREIMLEVWKSIDLDADIRAHGRKVAHALLEDSGGEINVFTDYLTRVATECCLNVYGLKVPNSDDFADYCLACMALLFGDPNGNPKYREQAETAGARLRAILNQNIDRTAEADAEEDPKILRRIVENVGEGRLDLTKEQRDEVRAMLFGLLIGFVPTNTLSAANIIEELVSRRRLLAAAVKQARELERLRSEKGDRDEDYLRLREAFERFLFETGRMNPALFPGQFRVRTEEAQSGLPRRLARIKPATVVMVSTASALMDKAGFSSPGSHDPDRWLQQSRKSAGHDLQFGYGIHECIGTALAKALITESLQILFSQPGFKFSDKRAEFSGPVPRKMTVRFDVEAGHNVQSQISALVPLKDVSDKPAVVTLLDQLYARDSDGSATLGIRKIFDETGIVHFASINLVELGNDDKSDPFVLFEFNVDGEKPWALRKLFSHLEGKLDYLAEYLSHPRKSTSEKLFSWWSPRPEPEKKDDDLGPLYQLISRNVLRFHCWPWGSIGLNFVGTGQFSVQQIAREQALFRKIDESSFAQQKRAGRGDDFSPKRRGDEGAELIPSGPDGIPPEQFLIENARELVRGDPAFEGLLYRTSASVPKFSKHDPSTYLQFLVRFALRKPFNIIYPLLFLATLVLPVVLIKWNGWASWFGSYVATWWVPILLLVTVFAIALVILRYHETKIDQPEDIAASHDHMQKLQSMEDLPGYSQNHITSVSQMKPGWFRKSTLALALLVIRQMTIQWFRPGFITDFATIHYARWFRPAGSDKLIFQSNYDGSWESYLEDFITKVHGGQTIAWNNGVGFPRTNWWFQDGAKDGDKFKRWVRRQQIKTNFWYARFPELTTDHIRTNASVGDGLARARTTEEYRQWEKLFGSVHRPKEAIETDQVQTILFNGMGSHGFAKCHLLKIEDRDLAREWLRGMVDSAKNTETPSQLEDLECQLHFGDERVSGPAKFIAFTAPGLSLLKDDCSGILDEFPHAFVDGMSNRARILGDEQPDGAGTHPRNWIWKDAEIRPVERSDEYGSDENVAHIALMVFSNDPNQYEDVQNDLATELMTHGLAEIAAFDMATHDASGPLFAFDFKDGISQPVMQGTRNFAAGKHNQNDAVGPGEFILGYPDSRGYYPPSPKLSAEAANSHFLPPTEPAISESVVEFNNRNLTFERDLGRNGTFLVIRQLKTDEELFQQFVDGVDLGFNTQTGDMIPASPYPSAGPVASPSPSDDVGPHDDHNSGVHMAIYSPSNRTSFKRAYVPAKMMGRWRDGSSLTRNPYMSRTHSMRASFWSEINDAVFGMLGNRELMGNAGIKPKIIAMHEAQLAQPGQASYSRSDVVWEDEVWERFLEDCRELYELVGEETLPKHKLESSDIDNDFQHGTDDPQGIYCPIGSHVRRTNPRDSMGPGQALQLEINNRHRLIRRGRVYGEWETDTKFIKQGLMFMCFNANIERQFEFVQQSWVESRFFHGLKSTPDPIVSWKNDSDKFDIVTSNISLSFSYGLNSGGSGGEGPLANFTQVVGGGYFFLPGKQALRFLAR